MEYNSSQESQASSSSASSSTPVVNGQSYPSYPSYPVNQPDQPTVEGSLADQSETTSAYHPYTPYGGGDYGNGMMMPPTAASPKQRGRGILLPAMAGALIAVLLLLGAFAIGHAAGTTSGGTSTAGSHATAPTLAVPASAQDLQQTVINVVQTDQPSVVEVTSQGSQGEAIGSGVVIRADGYIVTNDHVVSGFSSFTVTLSNGSQQPAQVVGQDPNDDLAVLKISVSGLRSITLANSSNVRVGEFAVALGNPLGLQQSATFGIVSALNRTANEGQGGTTSVLTGLVQTSAPINPGNSGGALVDLQGQLIGIPTLGATNNENGGAADGIGFAIPANRVNYVVNQLLTNGKVTATGQGFLGIQGEDVTPQVAAANGLSVQSGVLIGGFSNDAAGASPAQQAGIKQGDVITSVNGTTVNSSNDLAGVLLNLKPGTKVSVVVERGSSQQTITVTLGERPTNTNG